MGKGRRVHRGAVSVFILNRGRQAPAAWDATGIPVRLVNCLWLPGCWFVFLPPSLKGMWYRQKSHSCMCCGNTCYMRFFRKIGNPALQEKSGSFRITSIILCYADSIPPSAIQKATLLQDPQF